MLRPVKEHSVHGGTVFSSLNYAVVISRLWVKISDILPSSILRKPALRTLGYCKSFLCPRICNFVSLYEVELKNTVLGPVNEHLVHRSTTDFLLLLPNICELVSKVFWFTVNIIATCDCLSYVILELKSTLVPLFSFGVMFTLTSYLVMVTLKLNRKRGRCRVNSCI